MPTNSIEELFNSLKRFRGNSLVVASELEIPLHARKNGEVKSVLVHAMRYGIGGLERVVGLQCEILVKAGFRVNLVLSSPIPDRHYPLPKGVGVHYVPAAIPTDIETVRVRETALLSLVREMSADVYLDSAYLCLTEASPLILSDWMALKVATNVRVVVHWHNVFSRFLCMPEGMAFARHLRDVARFCDGMIVLSRIDQLFFSGFGFNARYLPNPVDPALVASAVAVECPRHGDGVLLWCGRMVKNKRPILALQLFSLVRDRMPGIRMIMVGDGDPLVMAEVRTHVKEQGLENSVELTGELLDPYGMYARADIFLSTSETEGFPMTFVEAFAHSMPVISIGKGYLELLRNNDGVRVFSEGGIRSAVQGIVDLLGNDAELIRARAAAYANVLNCK